MTTAKFSISLTPELAEVLSRMAKERKEDRSRLIEMLLRENPLVGRAIAEARGPANPGTKNGRDVQKVLALGRMAERQGAARAKAGKVAFLGR